MSAAQRIRTAFLTFGLIWGLSLGLSVSMGAGMSLVSTPAWADEPLFALEGPLPAVHPVTVDHVLADPWRYDNWVLEVTGVLYVQRRLLCTAPTELGAYHFRPPNCLSLHWDQGWWPYFEGQRATVKGRFHLMGCERKDPRLQDLCNAPKRPLTRERYDALDEQDKAGLARPPRQAYPDHDVLVLSIGLLDEGQRGKP